MSITEKTFLLTAPSVAVWLIVFSIIARILKRFHPSISLISIVSFLAGVGLLFIVFILAEIAKPN